jgi:hypothetical protein
MSRALLLPDLRPHFHNTEFEPSFKSPSLVAEVVGVGLKYEPLDCSQGIVTGKTAE